MFQRQLLLFLPPGPPPATTYFYTRNTLCSLPFVFVLDNHVMIDPQCSCLQLVLLGVWRKLVLTNYITKPQNTAERNSTEPLKYQWCLSAQAAAGQAQLAALLRTTGTEVGNCRWNSSCLLWWSSVGLVIPFSTEQRDLFKLSIRAWWSYWRCCSLQKELILGLSHIKLHDRQLPEHNWKYSWQNCGLRQQNASRWDVKGSGPFSVATK